MSTTPIDSNAGIWEWRNALHRSELKPRTILLGLRLSHYVNGSRDWQAWPSQETLAEATGQSRRHVRERLDELVEAGWIQATGGRRGKAARYSLTASREEVGTETGPSTSEQHGPDSAHELAPKQGHDMAQKQGHTLAQKRGQDISSDPSTDQLGNIDNTSSALVEPGSAASRGSAPTGSPAASGRPKAKRSIFEHPPGHKPRKDAIDLGPIPKSPAA